MNKFYFFSLIFLFSLGANAQISWTGAGDGMSWNDAANWDAGVPTAADIADIGTNVTVTSDTPVAAVQVKITGQSTVVLDLDLTVGDGVTVEHAVTVGLNSTVTFGTPGGNRTVTFQPEATRQGIAVFGGSENAVINVAESTTLDFNVANNGVNLAGPGSMLTNDGTMNFTSGVNNAFKILSSVVNNGDINIGNVTGDAVGVGEGGDFVNNGTITVDKPNNDAVEVEGGSFTNNGTITATVKDDAGSGNNVIAVGTNEIAGTFINGADGTINGDAGAADNARAISVNELGNFINGGTITLSGGNDGSRFFNRGTTVNDVNGIIDLGDGRVNVNMGDFTNNGLLQTTRDGAGVTTGETATATNNAFIDYASTNNFAIGQGTTTDNGFSLNSGSKNFNNNCFDTLTLQSYEYFYEGNSLGMTNAAGELDVTDANFIDPDSVQITTTIPGVAFFIRNYCDEAILIDAVNNLETAALRVYPTVAAAGAPLSVDLTEITTAAADMILTDFTGKVIRTQTLRGGEINRISGTQTPAGIYFLQVFAEGKVLTAKVVFR